MCAYFFKKTDACDLFEEMQFESQHFMIETHKVKRSGAEFDLELWLFLNKPVAKKHFDVKLVKGKYNCMLSRINIFGEKTICKYEFVGIVLTKICLHLAKRSFWKI